MRPNLRLAALVVAALLPLATSCSDGADDPRGGAPASASPTPSVPKLSITGTEYAFEITGSVTAGLTEVAFQNTGDEEHMTGLGKLLAGKTLADVQSALSSEAEDAFASVFDPREGDKDAPQLLSPGFAASTYTTLTAGTYALICFIPAPDGEPHWQKGMISELTVAATPRAAAETPPAPTAELSFKSGTLTGPATLPAGRTVLKVTTDANHELIGVVGLNGATPEEALAYFEAKFEGTPPTGPAKGGIALQLHDFEPADSILVELLLSPGPIMFVCLLEGEGQPAHTEKLTITVT